MTQRTPLPIPEAQLGPVLPANVVDVRSRRLRDGHHGHGAPLSRGVMAITEVLGG